VSTLTNELEGLAMKTSQAGLALERKPLCDSCELERVVRHVHDGLAAADVDKLACGTAVEVLGLGRGEGEEGDENERGLGEHHDGGGSSVGNKERGGVRTREVVVRAFIPVVRFLTGRPRHAVPTRGERKPRLGWGGLEKVNRLGKLLKWNVNNSRLNNFAY
jgi:hypothetical protein